MAALGKFLGKVVDKVLASPIGSKSPEIQRAGHIAKRVSDQIVADEGTGAIDVQAARDALRAVGMGGNVGRRIEDIHREALEAAITQTSFLPSSVLFVPLSNLKALRKIPTINADAFILDLEDAVPPNKKDDARNNLVDLCKNGEFANKRLYVRVNSPRITPHIGMQDLDACGIVSKFIHGVCIPKTEHADIDIVDGAMHDETPLWAFIETAVGVQQVERILGSKRFKAVVVGSNDLGTELGLPRLTPAQAQQLPPRFGLQYAQSRIVMAARAAGIPVIDGVFNDHSDMKGLATDCLVGQALGFDGKSLIHPAQVPVCNAAFDPTPEQIAWARKVITAVAVSGGGATVCDGEMVEELHARRAREVLKRADLVASRSIVIESPLKRNREEEEAKMRFLSKVIGEEASAEELLMPAPPGSLNKENNNKDDNSTRGESEPLRPKSASEELRFIAKEEEVNPNEFQDPASGTNSAQTGSSSSGGGDAKAADNDDVSSLSSLDRQEARDSRRTPRGAAPKRNGPRNFKLVKEEEFYPNLDDQLHVRFRP